MPLSRNNHYIPQMYLSRWLNKGKIAIYQLLVPHEKVPLWEYKSVEHTGSMLNLYVNVFNGEESDRTERLFCTDFESPAKNSMDKVCNNKKLENQDWTLISDYVAAQYIRTPSYYFWVKNWGNQYVPEILEEEIKKFESIKTIPNECMPDKNASLLPIGIRTVDEKESMLEISTIVGKGLWLYLINHELTTDSLLRKHFRNMKWSIIYAPDEDNWPSCDNPVVLCHVEGKVIHRISTSSGMIGNNKAIVFPLSPKIVLFAQPVRKFPWKFQADAEMALMIKEVIVNNALRYVYAYADDEKIVSIRSRTVDLQELKRIKDSFDNWFDYYKEFEGPLLKKQVPPN